MWTTLVDEAPRFFGYYNLLFLGQAFVATAGLSLIGCAFGLAAGFGLALMRHPRVSRFLPGRLLAIVWVELFRRIPFLVLLMCVFFAFQLSGLDIGLFGVALATVTLSASAFSAENVRAGLEGVHRTQWDAAEAMNLSAWQTLRSVVLPQAWPIIIPASMTFSVGLVKNTAIASQIGVLELTYAAKVLNTKGFSAAICFGTILVLYFVLCYGLSRSADILQRRLDPRRVPRVAAGRELSLTPATEAVR
jgi:polar amino acid transport system permease protein